MDSYAIAYYNWFQSTVSETAFLTNITSLPQEHQGAGSSELYTAAKATGEVGMTDVP